MKNIIRMAAATAAFTVAGVGMAGVATAEDERYVPTACTQTVDGVVTAVSCVSPETEVSEAPNVAAANVEAATAVQSSGTLPFTGNNSSLPLAEAGVALLAAGGGLLLVVKRRQAADHS
jgi:LPXTG-motif cell wall-anchored protein